MVVFTYLLSYWSLFFWLEHAALWMLNHSSRSWAVDCHLTGNSFLRRLLCRLRFLPPVLGCHSVTPLVHRLSVCLIVACSAPSQTLRLLDHVIDLCSPYIHVPYPISSGDSQNPLLVVFISFWFQSVTSEQTLCQWILPALGELADCLFSFFYF